jgi:beta-glucosidase
VALIGAKGATPMPAGFGAMWVAPTAPVTAEAALSAILGPRLHYYDGADIATAAAIARQSSVAVVVVNDVEAERRDRSNLELPGNQNALVTAVAGANRRTIVVLETGSAVLMPWISDVPAVLETWYPGETAGSALVDLLTGRVDPSGKLPVTFPTSESSLTMPDATAATFGGVDGKTIYADGVDVGYRWYEVNSVTPLFSFGYGLSYTRFHFSALSSAPAPDGGVDVQATVTNVGSVAGADVVQCYVGFPARAGEAPRQLRGFARVDLGPRQSKTVSFALRPGDLATWDSATGSWVVPGGSYQLYVGDGSDLANLPLTTTVNVTAASLGVDSGPALP